jgi:hypothetical protein
MITTSEAIGDPKLLGGAFAGSSWDTWRAVLRAAEGLPLTDDQHRDFCRVAERDPPNKRVRELWAIVGRRGGKDSIASAIASTAALIDYRPYLRPGERAVVMSLACDRAQARIQTRYVTAYFNENPLLKPLVTRETEDGLELNNGVEIIVGTNSYRAVRGRSLAAVVLSEVAFWRDESSSTPDFETYSALIPGLITLPGAMLIGISSPYRRSGLLFDRWRQYYGTDDPDVLIVRGPSTTFNPTLPRTIIDQALERDPEAAAAEWLGEWRSDLADYIDRAVVEGAIARGRYELPPVTGVSYGAFVDAAGGTVGGDSMTLAIGHRDGDRGILDAVREIRPPFSPEAAVAEFAELLKTYGIQRVIGDRWGSGFVQEKFQQHGLDYQLTEKTKSDIYRDLLPLLNSGKVELIDHPRLIQQLCALERRTTRGGRDTTDHPVGGRDDCSNAGAGILVELIGGPPMPHYGIWKFTIDQAAARETKQAAEREAAKPVIEFARGSVEWLAQQQPERERGQDPE